MALIDLIKKQQAISNAISETIATTRTTEKTPVNAVAATGTLTISGVVVDGETATINEDTYEFAADAAQTVGAGNVAVDITSHTTAAQGTLTVDTQVTADDTMTIGSKQYTFVSDGTANADGEITVGTDLAAGQAAIVAAINGTDGHNDPHPSVSAGDFGSNDSVITALVGGTAGNSIATTSSFTTGTNTFDDTSLGTTTSGVDCTAANADGALIGADAGSDYTLSQGTGESVDVTADTKGVIGNSYATTETMTNGAFGDTTLTGGVNGTLGLENQIVADDDYIYVAVKDNGIHDANWERVAISSF